MDEKTKIILEKVKASAAMVGDLTMSAAVTVGKKAGDVVEQSKLNLKLFDLQNEVDLLMKKIGRQLYQAHTDPDMETPDFEELFAAVDQKAEEMQELRDKLEMLRRTKKCPNPNCGKTCTKDAAYCPACGTALN